VKTRARRPLPMMASTVLLLLITGLVVVGCSAGFNLSCGDTDPGTKTYTDDTYGYSFDYPGDWVVQEGDNADVTAGSGSEGGVSVYDPEGTVAGEAYIDLFQVSVYELAVTVDDSMMPEIKGEVERLLADLETQGGWTRTIDLTDTAVGDVKGYEVTYTFTTDGTPATSTFYFLFTGAVQYQLTRQAATKNWEKMQPDFDAIVSSFAPGAGS
jgi:hypothetical protein